MIVAAELTTRVCAADLEGVLATLELDLFALFEQRHCPLETDAALVRRRVGPADVIPTDEADRQVLQRASFTAGTDARGGQLGTRRGGGSVAERERERNSRQVEGDSSPDELVVARHSLWRRMQEEDILDERSVGAGFEEIEKTGGPRVVSITDGREEQNGYTTLVSFLSRRVGALARCRRFDVHG